MQCTLNFEDNTDRAVQKIREAARDGGQVICLQELFNTPYPCQAEDHQIFQWAQSIPGPATDLMSKIAKELSVVIVVPLFQRRAPGLYHNSAAVIDADGSIAGVYQKMHIPDDPLFYEKFYFTPGEWGFHPIQTKYAKLGIGICWDQWYPEAARLFALAGAEILLYPTAIGWIHKQKAELGEIQRDSWLISMRAHAVANGLFLGAPNRVGIEEGLDFWGSSFICGPSGQMLAQAGDHDEAIVTADCQIDAIDRTRTAWPFLRDRRIDEFSGLTRRYID
jgi:N-carbamoylputrescine amidase